MKSHLAHRATSVQFAFHISVEHVFLAVSGSSMRSDVSSLRDRLLLVVWVGPSLQMKAMLMLLPDCQAHDLVSQVEMEEPEGDDRPRFSENKCV